MIQGMDCARPMTQADVDYFSKAGVEFVARYLVPPHLAWKRLTITEANRITDAGMKIISVFETTASRPSGGAKYGAEDGALAFIEAKAIGQPALSTIYFAADWDAQELHYDAIEAYLRAAAVACPGYRIGVYGSYKVIEAMADRKACQSYWQTYAWSGGKKSARANIYQYQNGVQANGLTYDKNYSYGYEGWWTTKVEAPTTPKVVINDTIVVPATIVDGKMVASIADVLDALGIEYTYHNDIKKLFIYKEVK